MLAGLGALEETTMHLLDHAENMAKEAEGNWRKFQSFGWHDKPENAERFAIVYTHNRDSGLVELSNASVIEKRMSEFCEGDDPDCYSESHGHWACGWVDGYAIRVRKDDGTLTPAWIAWCEMALALENYPLLDEEDHSRREHEAALEAINQEGRRMTRDDVPEGWESEVHEWLWNNNSGELEDDGQGHGPYPSEDAIREALEALGYAEPEEDDE